KGARSIPSLRSPAPSLERPVRGGLEGPGGEVVVAEALAAAPVIGGEAAGTQAGAQMRAFRGSTPAGPPIGHLREGPTGRREEHDPLARAIARHAPALLVHPPVMAPAEE